MKLCRSTIITVIFSSLLLIGFLSACTKSSEQQKSLPSPQAQIDVIMVKVEAGEFIHGSDKKDSEGLQQRFGFPNPLYLDESPKKTRSLPAFYIDKFEVSNKSYKQYIFSSNKMIPYDWMSNGYALSSEQLESMDVDKLRKLAAEYARLDVDTTQMDKAALLKAMQGYQAQIDKFPVGNVSWFDAKDYCEWRGGRLPSEMEWEKAARGKNGNEYPWGNEWNPKFANTGDDGEWEDGIAPVGSYPKNISPYGVMDMAGNVWEWVSDWYQAYPDSTYQSNLYGETYRVIRGGGGGMGHYAISYFYRASTRQYSEPDMQSADVGFRCVKETSE